MEKLIKEYTFDQIAHPNYQIEKAESVILQLYDTYFTYIEASKGKMKIADEVIEDSIVLQKEEWLERRWFNNTHAMKDTIQGVTSYWAHDDKLYYVKISTTDVDYLIAFKEQKPARKLQDELFNWKLHGKTI